MGRWQTQCQPMMSQICPVWRSTCVYIDCLQLAACSKRSLLCSKTNTVKWNAFVSLH